MWKNVASKSTRLYLTTKHQTCHLSNPHSRGNVVATSHHHHLHPTISKHQIWIQVRRLQVWWMTPSHGWPLIIFTIQIYLLHMLRVILGLAKCQNLKYLVIILVTNLFSYNNVNIEDNFRRSFGVFCKNIDNNIGIILLNLFLDRTWKSWILYIGYMVITIKFKVKRYDRWKTKKLKNKNNFFCKNHKSFNCISLHEM